MDNKEYHYLLYQIQQVYLNYKEIIAQTAQITMSQIKQYNIFQLNKKLEKERLK